MFSLASVTNGHHIWCCHLHCELWWQQKLCQEKGFAIKKQRSRTLCCPSSQPLPKQLCTLHTWTFLFFNWFQYLFFFLCHFSMLIKIQAAVSVRQREKVFMVCSKQISLNNCFSVALHSWETFDANEFWVSFWKLNDSNDNEGKHTCKIPNLISLDFFCWDAVGVKLRGAAGQSP